MKKVRKVLSTLFAFCLMFSFAAPAFAVSVYYIPAYDETKEYGLVESGVLDDGTEYWVINLTPEEIVQNSLLRSYDWSGTKKVPITNESGTNGATLGYSFTAYPDEYVAVQVGPLPSVMPTVNVGFYYSNGSNSSWYPNVGGDCMVVFKLAYPSNEGSIKVSTYETASKTTSFSFYTSSTNPADSYLDV